MHRTKNGEEKEGHPREKQATTRPHSRPGAVPEGSPVSLFLPGGWCHYPRFIDEATQTQRSCPARRRESWVPDTRMPHSWE